MNDEEREPLSSEDLVRRARESFDRDGVGPRTSGDDGGTSSVTDSGVASSIDPVEEYAEFPRESSPPVDAGTDPTEPAVEIPAPPEPASVLSEEELEASWDAPSRSDDRRSWDPDWSPGDAATGYRGDAPVGGPDPDVLPPGRPAPRSAPRRRRFGGWIIGLAIFGGIALFGYLDSTKSVAALDAGDCLQDPGLVEVIENVETIDCDEPHEVEVFAKLELTGPGAATGAGYPGPDAVYEQGFAQCEPRFEGYVGTVYEDSVYWIDAWTPVREGWDDGDRGVLCVIYELTEGFDLKASTFSARNSGR